MVETLTDTVAENIEIVDSPEEITEQDKITLWLAISALLALAIVTFLIVRNIMRGD